MTKRNSRLSASKGRLHPGALNRDPLIRGSEKQTVIRYDARKLKAAAAECKRLARETYQQPALPARPGYCALCGEIRLSKACAGGLCDECEKAVR